MCNARFDTKLGLYLKSIQRNLGQISFNGGVISLIDCVLVKKLPYFYQGMTSYSMRTFEKLEEHIQDKVNDRLIDYKEKNEQ